MIIKFCMKVPDKKPNELRKEQDDFANKVLRNLKHDYGDMADKLFDFNLQPKFGIKRTGKAKIPSWFMYYEIQVSPGQKHRKVWFKYEK